MGESKIQELLPMGLRGDLLLCKPSPQKTNMTTEKEPFEDASPIKTGNFPLPCFTGRETNKSGWIFGGVVAFVHRENRFALSAICGDHICMNILRDL